MNLRSDLARIIGQELDSAGVEFDPGLSLIDLAASYFQTLTRMVTPKPRRVHFSDELQDSLGALARESDQTIRSEARAAWQAAFRLNQHMSEGRNVNPHLSRRIATATGKGSNDGLLFDYGMHHFHLNSEVEPDGFIKRSQYLLFAVVTESDVYFVDVRKHPKGRDLGWVRQDLVAIVDSNWPQLLEANALHGVWADTITDERKQELRSNNANHLSPVAGKVFVPLGGGTTGNGSSMRCRMEAIRLLREIDHHQRTLESLSAELKEALETSGIGIGASWGLELAKLEGLNLPPEATAELNGGNCLSRVLSRMGFVIVEHTSKVPIVVAA